MISTVTTSTISTLTSVALVGTLSLLAVVALLIFLIQKEILTVAGGSRAEALGRVLNIAIVPLLVGFLFIALVKVAEYW